MSELDDDAIHLAPGPDSAAAHFDHDLSDELQDFRFLNSLTLVTENAPATLPRRGEKDFEPNPTVHQSDVLASSREAMHNAIAHTRLHPRKTQIIGVYAPGGPVPPWVESKPAPKPKLPLDLQDLEDEELDRPVKHREAMDTVMNAGKEQKVMGIPADACVYVSSPKGQLFNSVGKADSFNRVWLLPEEALYLLERGSLDIRWPGSMTSENAAEDDELPDNVPMTLQAAYACLIGRGALSLERFSVYTGLKRLGYVVIRSPTWDNDHADIPMSQEFRAQSRIAKKMTDSTFLTFMRDSLGGLFEKDITAQGPMIGLSSFRNYNQIYSRLQLKWEETEYLSTVQELSGSLTDPPYRTAFYVYKPSTPFRKSAPPEPDFRIAVVDARTHTTLPRLSQLRKLLDSAPDDPPVGEKMRYQLYARLKHGLRNVLLAVVDQGIVSYLRFSDAGFTQERLFEQMAPKGPKTGRHPGKGKGKGRGR